MNENNLTILILEAIFLIFAIGSLLLAIMSLYDYFFWCITWECREYYLNHTIVWISTFIICLICFIVLHISKGEETIEKYVKKIVKKVIESEKK